MNKLKIYKLITLMLNNKIKKFKMRINLKIFKWVFKIKMIFQVLKGLVNKLLVNRLLTLVTLVRIIWSQIII